CATVSESVNFQDDGSFIPAGGNWRMPLGSPSAIAGTFILREMAPPAARFALSGSEVSPRYGLHPPLELIGGPYTFFEDEQALSVTMPLTIADRVGAGGRTGQAAGGVLLSQPQSCW